MDNNQEEKLRNIRELIDKDIERFCVGGKFDGKKLGEFTDFVATSAAKHIEELTAVFPRREIYPNRPMVQLYGCAGKDAPVVWLLGWRDDLKTLEETDIHDHDDSRVVVKVIRGRVTEVVYAVDDDLLRQKAPALPFEVLQRSLEAGDSEVIEPPSIHQVADYPDNETAITLHAYYPPLDEMQMYKLVGQDLVPAEHWVENPSDKCN